MGKPEYPEKNLSVQSREPTHSTHMTPSLGIKLEPHWWEASALITVPPLHPKSWNYIILIVSLKKKWVSFTQERVLLSLNWIYYPILKKQKTSKQDTLQNNSMFRHVSQRVNAGIMSGWPLKWSTSFPTPFKENYWNATIQYHPTQCLLFLCNTYHRQPSLRSQSI